MDHSKAVVIDYLRSDKAMFINPECCVQFDHGGEPKMLGQPCSCDAVAIDLRHGAVYLCDTAFGPRLHSLLKKLTLWRMYWEPILGALRRDCMLPANWRVYVWLFVPRNSIEAFDAELEKLRQTIGSNFKVKITALEDVRPWRSSSWKRHEAAWERNMQRMAGREPANGSASELPHSVDLGSESERG